MTMSVNIVELSKNDDDDDDDDNNDIEQQNGRKGMEAKLYDAALNGLQEVVFQFNWLDRKTPINNNVLHVHVGKPLLRNGKSDELEESVNIEFIRAILSRPDGDSLLWKQNANGDTPLHLAARFCHQEAVREFLKKVEFDEEVAMSIFGMTNKRKDTALHEAARMGHAGIVDLLIRAASCNDPEKLKHQPNGAGETPVYLAAESGSTDAVASILNYCHPAGLNLKQKGPCGRTPLHALILRGTEPILGMIRKMMEIDRSLLRVQDSLGLTPLHCAASRRWGLRSRPVEVMLDYDDESNSAVYIQDNEGRTAVHVATLVCNWDVIKMLVSLCPDSVEIVDNKEQNVVHYAANLRCLKKLEALLRIRYVDKLINEQDIDGNTPLHLLVDGVPLIPVHLCFRGLGSFIKRNLVFTRPFNNANLTAGDVLAANTKFLKHSVPHVDWRHLTQVGRRVGASSRSRHRHHSSEAETESEGDAFDKKAVDFKGNAQYHLVVATLIATVSFAAGFTLPGGLSQNATDNMGIGMAVLTREASFKAFMISDTLAFIFSSLAIIFYLLIPVRSKLIHIDLFYNTGYLLTSLSLGALVIAFLTGVYAVISASKALSIGVFTTSIVFFSFYLPLLWANCGHLFRYAIRCTQYRNLQDYEYPL